jgi:translation initiation factor IF-2
VNERARLLDHANMRPVQVAVDHQPAAVSRSSQATQPASPPQPIAENVLVGTSGAAAREAEEKRQREEAEAAAKVKAAREAEEKRQREEADAETIGDSNDVAGPVVADETSAAAVEGITEGDEGEAGEPAEEDAEPQVGSSDAPAKSKSKRNKRKGGRK